MKTVTPPSEGRLVVLDRPPHEHVSNPEIVGVVDRWTRWAATAVLIGTAIAMAVTAIVVVISASVIATVLFLVALAVRTMTALVRR